MSKLKRLLEEEVAQSLTLNSIHNPANSTLSSYSQVPLNFQHLEYLDIKIEANGYQHLIDPITQVSYVINHEPKEYTVKNNKVILPGNEYETENPFLLKLRAAAGAAMTGTEGLSLLGMGTAGSSGAMVMRFTQILKVYNRLKYIGVNFGDNLDTYLTAIGEIFSDS